MISDKSLIDLLPLSLSSTPAVSIQKNNQIWCGAAMLIHCLESFTDSLVVTNGNSPIGIVGGKEIIEGIAKDPTSNFFDNKTIEYITSEKIVTISETTTLHDLIEKWKHTRRAFSVIPNQYGGLSAVSVRRILEIGIKCKTTLKISDIPKKDTITFRDSDDIGTIINLMLKHQTRRLLLKDSSEFISDRIIIEKIARDMNYLRDNQHFLKLPMSSFKLESAKIVDDNLPLPLVYDIMFGSLHPYIIYKDQVISPLDLCSLLLSDKIFLNN